MGAVRLAFRAESRRRWRSWAASQLAAANGATGAPPRPLGPTVAFHVVGIEAAVGEFPSGSAPVYDLFAARAFARTVIPRTADGYEYFVRLRGRAAGLARFDAEANALSAAGVEGYENGNVARSLAVALAGTAGAVALATALSPLTPVGEARLAETSTGVAFDLLVLPLGALVMVVVVLALGIRPALRAARTVRSGDQAEVARPSAVVARLAAIGAPPTAVIGVRQALQRKHGRTTIRWAAPCSGRCWRSWRSAERGSSAPASLTCWPRPPCRATRSSSISVTQAASRNPLSCAAS